MGLFKPFWMKVPYYSQDVKKIDKKISKIEDQNLLAEIAEKAPYSHTCEYALSKITDSTLLDHLIITSTNNQFRRLIVWKVTNQQLLYELGMNDPDGYIRKLAAANITTPARAQEVYVNTVKTHDLDDSYRVAAYNLIEDDNIKLQLEKDANFAAAKKRRDDEMKRFREVEKWHTARQKKINDRYAAGRCPHCGVQLTGWDNYNPPTGLKEKPTTIYTCSACGKAI